MQSTPLTVHPVGRTEPVRSLDEVASARQEAFQRALSGQLGKQFTGETLARLGDGSFVVRVAGIAARMQLPAGAQPGAEVELTLVALQPRPTFQVGAAPGQPAILTEAAATWHPSGQVGRAALLAAAVAQGTPGPLSQADLKGTPTAISDTGKLLARVVAAAGNGQAAAIIARTPLLAGPGLAPALMASSFREAIGKSGLFYESHLAEWSQGQRSLAELAREPQMLKAFAAHQPHAGVADGGAPETATAQFINQQLSAHEHSRIAWQGELWPGQPMAWEIERADPGAGGGDGSDGAAATWRSALRLRFAGLGEIDATVMIAGDQLHIALNTSSRDTEAALRARAGELAAALGSAGSPLASLDIRATVKPGDD